MLKERQRPRLRKEQGNQRALWAQGRRAAWTSGGSGQRALRGSPSHPLGYHAAIPPPTSPLPSLLNHAQAVISPIFKTNQQNQLLTPTSRIHHLAGLGHCSNSLRPVPAPALTPVAQYQPAATVTPRSRSHTGHSGRGCYSPLPSTPRCSARLSPRWTRERAALPVSSLHTPTRRPSRPRPAALASLGLPLDTSSPLLGCHERLLLFRDSGPLLPP